MTHCAKCCGRGIRKWPESSERGPVIYSGGCAGWEKDSGSSYISAQTSRVYRSFLVAERVGAESGVGVEEQWLERKKTVLRKRINTVVRIRECRGHSDSQPIFLSNMSQVFAESVKNKIWVLPQMRLRVVQKLLTKHHHGCTTCYTEVCTAKGFTNSLVKKVSRADMWDRSIECRCLPHPIPRSYTCHSLALLLGLNRASSRLLLLQGILFPVDLFIRVLQS